MSKNVFLFQVKYLVRVIIPLRDVQLVEKNDNPVGGAVFPSSMVVTTKGKVCLWFWYIFYFQFCAIKLIYMKSRDCKNKIF